MIFEFPAPEVMVNEFMKDCREWLENGRPEHDVFKENRALCESFEEFLRLDKDLQKFKVDGEQETYQFEMAKIRRGFKQHLKSVTGDYVYPFNSSDDYMSDSEDFCLEVDAGVVWNNFQRVNFVMNFKDLEVTSG